MAKKTVVVSDFSGKEVSDEDVVSVIVLEYPELSQSIRLDASQVEVDRLKVESAPMALLEVIKPDGTVERFAVAAQALAKSIKGDADEIMSRAEAYSPMSQPEPEAPRRGRRPRGEGAPRPEKIDYTSVEHAGSVKRGLVSEGEKETVRTNFDEVNRNLEAAGQRQIDLSDIAMVEKYGLQELAKERGITPTPKS